jgi:HD-GYP domain-containing protein (c-di-GMP phosphodiesterase class II)
MTYTMHLDYQWLPLSGSLEIAKPDQDAAAECLCTIYTLLAAVDAKDHLTYGHAKNVGSYAVDIAEALGYSQEGVQRIRVASLLHDIGKIGIADWLLQKSEALTPDEWELIYTHPDLGVSIIKRVDSLNDCLAAIQYHHERYDGTGYPVGLKGSNIPLDARILAVADSYDAMVSSRPYRLVPLTHEQALEELKQCAGTQFDPVVVESFLELQSLSSRATIVAQNPGCRTTALSHSRFPGTS